MTQYKELQYDDRQELEAGKDATLVYENVYSGTVVEKEVTVTNTCGRLTVETDNGKTWGVFGSSVRTSINNRRQSGSAKPKNGRKLGYVVDLNQ